MLVEKVYTTCIDTVDPAVLYSTNINEAVKTILTTMYAGKNFYGCYILEILEIIRLSPVILESQRAGGSARINVSYRARGIVYDKFEVIPAAKIIEITDDGKIYLKSPYSSIILESDSRLQNYKKGQTVPVRVFESKYIAYKTSITVTGIPFGPLRDDGKEFEVTVSETDIQQLAPLLKQLEEELATFKKLDKKTRDAWCKLLDPPTATRMDKYKLTNIAKVSGHVVLRRPEWMPLADVDAVYMRIVDKTGKESIKDSVNILRGYVLSMIKSVITVNALANEYDVSESNAWQKLYKMQTA